MPKRMKKVGIKAPILTAISYLLPLVVASGLLIAIGNLTGGQNVKTLDGITVPDALTTIGVFGMGLLPSFIAGYIAYAIADRPGLAPGFLMGQIASFLGAGFLGGMIGGIIAGYIAPDRPRVVSGSLVPVLSGSPLNQVASFGCL